MNWVYTGETASDFKYRYKGRLYHSRQVSKTGFKKQYGQIRVVPKIEDCEKIPIPGKYRYLYPLDKKIKEMVAPLSKPYPKRASGQR